MADNQTKTMDVDDDLTTVVVTVKTQQDVKTVALHSSCRVKQLKEKTATAFGVEVESVCLIHSGTILSNDDDALNALGISNGSTLHMIVKAFASQGGRSTTATSETGPTTFDMSSLGALQFAAVGVESMSYGQLQQHLQRQMMSNPELIRQTVDNPIVQQLMENPTVLNNLVTSHPQAKDWLRRNPELAEMLKSPELMKQTREIAQNSEMLEELISAQKRNRVKTSGSSARNIAFGPASVPEFDVMWQKLAKNPQVIKQLFKLPYTKTMIDALEANPNLTRQLIAEHPVFADNVAMQQQLQYLMPQYLQQLKDPAMQSLMTNPKALQALVKIQQGLDLLHAEAPNLVSSFQIPFLSVPPPLATFMPLHLMDMAPANAETASETAKVMSSVMSQIVSQLASGQINNPPEVRFKDQLSTLMTMGYKDQHANIQALVGTLGDVNAAVDLLKQKKVC